MEISALSRLPCSLPRRSVSASLSPYSSSFSFSNSLLFRSRARPVLSHRQRRNLTCTCLFGLGVPELVVIAGVAALVFGPKKLPEVGKSIGKTVKSFQQAAKEFESELKSEPESLSEAPAQKPTVVVNEEEKQDKVASSKES